MVEVVAIIILIFVFCLLFFYRAEDEALDDPSDDGHLPHQD